MNSDQPNIEISVVIVSWNTRELLADCLESLFRHDGLAGVRGAEVWVVDNASTDDSVAMVRRDYPQVRLIVNTENVGFARANNRALRQASGRYLLLLNSDTVVPPGALSALVRALDAAPEAAACSPLLLNADGTPQICWARFPGIKSEISGRLDPGQSPYPIGDFGEPSKRSAMEPFAADWVGGACFLARASIVERVGLLDENFFMYSEETDWCRRFRDIGAQTLLVPTATVTHLGGRSSRRVPADTRRRMYKSSLRLYRLLYGPFGALLPGFIATARCLLSLFKSRRDILSS